MHKPSLLTPQRHKERTLPDQYFSVQEIETRPRKQPSLFDKFVCLGSSSKQDNDEVVTSLQPRKIQNNLQMFDNHVWYASYDQDMNIEKFKARMQELIGPEFEPHGIVPVQIKGWQVCFDTAISDAPFVC
jgi:hypothetical protein